MRKTLMLYAFVLFLAMFNFSCEREKGGIKSEGSSDSDVVKQEFTLKIKVTSGGEAVMDSDIVLNNPVSVTKTIEGSDYASLTRFRTGKDGDVTIEGLVLQTVEGDDLLYEVTIHRAGFESKTHEITAVQPGDEVNLEVELVKYENTIDLKFALLDYESNYRATDFMNRNKFIYKSVTGKLDDEDLSSYNVLALGLDASKFVLYVEEFAANRDKILSFVEDGGVLFFFQQNDTGWKSDFFPEPLALADENDGNDFASGMILDGEHWIATNSSEEDLVSWEYSEPGQSELKDRIVWDAISKENLGSGLIYVIQMAYYQATYGTVSDEKAKKFTENILEYLEGIGTAGKGG